jgi:glycerol kinase
VQEAAAQGELVLAPLASYILYALLEEKPLFTDPANGSRTLLLEKNSMQWDAALCELFDVPLTALPPIVANKYAFGCVALGDRRVPVNLCTGDQSAALFATGEPQADNFYINAGTGAFVQSVLQQQDKVDPRLLESVAFTDVEMSRIVRVQEGTVNGAARALDVVADQLGLDEPWVQSIDAWSQHYAQEILPLFINAVSGVGSPFWIAQDNSHFEPETAEAPLKMVAVLESIVFLLNVNMRCMRQSASGQDIARIILSGGLSNSVAFCQKLADVSGCEVLVTDQPEATAAGVFRLLSGRGARADLGGQSLVYRGQKNDQILERYTQWCALMGA